MIWTEVPTGPLVGLNDVIVGVPVPVPVTVKFVALVAVPSGLVTAIGPVFAPDVTAGRVIDRERRRRPVEGHTRHVGDHWNVAVYCYRGPDGPLAGENELIVGAAARAASTPGRLPGSR